MSDDVREVCMEDPNYQAALMSVIHAIQSSNSRDGSYQNGFSAILVAMAMLIEREPGIETNLRLRERCEALGRTVLLQAKIFRQEHEATGERQFDQLSALIDELAPTHQQPFPPSPTHTSH